MFWHARQIRWGVVHSRCRGPWRAKVLCLIDWLQPLNDACRSSQLPGMQLLGMRPPMQGHASMRSTP
jgi:hypothetical protein